MAAEDEVQASAGTARNLAKDTRKQLGVRSSADLGDSVVRTSARVQSAVGVAAVLALDDALSPEAVENS